MPPISRRNPPNSLITNSFKYFEKFPKGIQSQSPRNTLSSTKRNSALAVSSTWADSLHNQAEQEIGFNVLKCSLSRKIDFWIKKNRILANKNASQNYDETILRWSTFFPAFSEEKKITGITSNIILLRLRHRTQKLTAYLILFRCRQIFKGCSTLQQPTPTIGKVTKTAHWSIFHLWSARDLLLKYFLRHTAIAASPGGQTSLAHSNALRIPEKWVFNPKCVSRAGSRPLSSQRQRWQFWAHLYCSLIVQMVSNIESVGILCACIEFYRTKPALKQTTLCLLWVSGWRDLWIFYEQKHIN